MRFLISGFTFHYVDSQWSMKSFPMHFLNTAYIGKTAGEHEPIKRSAVTNNEKIGKRVLIFSGTSDNEPRLALGVYQTSSDEKSIAGCSDVFPEL